MSDLPQTSISVSPFDSLNRTPRWTKALHSLRADIEHSDAIVSSALCNSWHYREVTWCMPSPVIGGKWFTHAVSSCELTDYHFTQTQALLRWWCEDCLKSELANEHSNSGTLFARPKHALLTHTDKSVNQMGGSSAFKSTFQESEHHHDSRKIWVYHLLHQEHTFFLKSTIKYSQMSNYMVKRTSLLLNIKVFKAISEQIIRSRILWEESSAKGFLEWKWISTPKGALHGGYQISWAFPVHAQHMSSIS